ncbi:serine hydrolase domain-containing protein [Nonomuraea cavernae]|uniref:serine hydrolase domain-containing protein n=1 Tax=Nonomuraea cavernae TaxID=2045107 RepID=UPI0033FC1F57
MGRAATAVVAGLVILAVPGPASAKGEPDEAAIQRVVSDFARNAGYPGIAVAISKGDQVLYTGGYGKDSSGAAVTATTPVPAASISKSFTALAVMQLVEARKVTLNAPVRDYLPDFRISDSRGGQITVRDLLNQTSGITDNTLPEKSLPQPDSLAGAVTRAHDATLAVDPGTKYSYTNTNYHLAARLVEAVAGEPFADYLRRHVFEPIGMRATATIDQTPRDLPRDVRKGYMYAYGVPIPVTEPKRFVNGSDGVVTTAEDLAKWLIVHSNAGRAANGTQPVSASSIAAMHTSSDRRWTYGMGWNTDQKGRVRHSGVWFTYTAEQLLLPGGYGIAVIGNSGIGLINEGIGSLADELATLVTGGEPSPGVPLRLIVDLTLAGLTLLSVFLGVRNLRRTRAWAERLADRPSWRLVPRLLPRLIPFTLLTILPDLLGGLVGGGRDLTFIQLCYYSVALVTWAAVAAMMNISVLITRVVALTHLRRSADSPVRWDVSAQIASR